MPITILQTKNDLEAILHGTTLNDVVNIDGLFNRTAAQLILDVDPQETKRIVPLVSPIYTQVFDYALPVDVKGNRIIDLQPQVNRSPSDLTPQTYIRQFDTTKLTPGGQMFQIQFNSGIKTIRINRTQAPIGVTLNEADLITGNGTWVTFGGATNLTVDNVNFASGSSSLKFDLSAGQFSGGLENSTMTALDLSNFLNQSTNFLYVYLPTATSVTSVNLRWGSSAADYYTVTTTVTQENTVFQNGWNLLAFNWLGATVVGNPDPTNITYLRVTYNYNGALQTGVHLDNIVNRMGEIINCVYYSKYLFRDAATGAFQETVTDDSNIINLDTESYMLFLNLLSYLAGQQIQGINETQFDYQFFLSEYNKNLLRYRMLYKSEVSAPQSIYYQKPNNNVGQYYNRRNNY